MVLLALLCDFLVVSLPTTLQEDEDIITQMRSNGKAASPFALLAVEYRAEKKRLLQQALGSFTGFSPRVQVRL